MAKTTSSSTMIFNLLLILSFLLFFSVTDSKFLGGKAFGLPKAGSSSLRCDSAYGVKSGDNCAAIAETFKLSTQLFESINPNLNCSALFVGQWLCVGDTSS